MVGIRVNFTALLGKMTKMTGRYTERKRTVRCTVPKSKTLYKEVAVKRWEGKGGRTLKNGQKRQIKQHKSEEDLQKENIRRN